MFRSVLRTVVLPRAAPSARLPVRALHASPMLRDEEKAAAVPESRGFLSDWRVQLPIGFLAAIPLLHNQIFILNEETQLLGCFMVFVGTMYTQAGDLIGKALDAKGQAVIAEHNAQEQVNIAAVYAVIAAHEKNLTLVQDMQSILTLQVELMETLDKAKMMEYQHTVRNDVVKKLDYFAAKEDQFRASVQSILVAKATASVEESFKTVKTLQDNALAMAMATIADPTKVQPDAVAPVYADFFKKNNEMVAAKVASLEGTELNAEQLEAADAETFAFRKRFGYEKIEDLTMHSSKFSSAVA